MTLVTRSLSAALMLSLTLTLGACKRQYAVGDKVLVEWEGNVYPAVILEAVSPTKYKVHFEGYDTVWDEVVVRDRIRGVVEGKIVNPEPPPKVRAKALQAAQTNMYRVGDRVRVEFHGQMYPAVITAIVGQERYRIHYEGYGPEWDETVGLSRIQPK
ncbi:MAG TPA: Tudor-knot domain-containing protein [Candidatus Nanopelagicales bacterium]|nr:Tudor-knot domain-containing protein [Candidatus Nanopelagicales bacterium]